VDGGIFMVII